MGESWFDNVANILPNPEPVISKEAENLVNDFLSPAKLRTISRSNDLNKVQSIEMKVNTAETTLGNFGQYLPILKQLRLSDSFVPSVRDIGTSFNCLTVLWMSRCHIEDIDGIASMPSLQELYISYNNIIDLSPISFLENLEVLDLEGNKISDLDQLDYLSIMHHLSTLTLAGNPVCRNYKSKSKKNFRDYVLRLLPHLEQFDDVSTKVSDPKVLALSHSQEDIDIITNAIKDGIDLENDLRPFSPELTAYCPNNKPKSSSSTNILPVSFSLSPLKKFTSTRPVTAAAASRQKPLSFEESNSTRPNSTESDDVMLMSDDSSNLTFGDPLCGNPIQALKQRRKGPMLAFNSFSNDFENLDYQLPPRPVTSLGFQRQVRLADKGWLGFLDRNVPATSSKPKQKSSFSNSLETCKETALAADVPNGLKSVTNTNGLYVNTSISPSTSQVSGKCFMIAFANVFFLLKQFNAK